MEFKNGFPIGKVNKILVFSFVLILVS